MAITLSSVSAVATAIRRASKVQFGSFVLGGGAIRDALVDAAKRGARVDVVLPSRPYKTGANGSRENHHTAALLRKAGAAVTFHDNARGDAWFHLKGAICDGVAYLDDRNFATDGNEIVVADDAPSDVAAIAAALRGTLSPPNTAIALHKDDALAHEAALIERAGNAPVIVETETIGSGAVASALREHARRGAPTTLIVARAASHDRREARLLARLRSDGVEVRTNGSREKLALAGDSAWIGSANATYAGGIEGRQVDWGILTRDAALVNAVRSALQRDAAREDVRSLVRRGAR